jgi:putative addiction module component (TIGR02574 family)
MSASPQSHKALLELEVGRTTNLKEGHTISGIPKALEDEIMRLPTNLRARLAERLIASLDQDSIDPDAEMQWVVEAQRRAEELASDKAVGIPAEQALARARAALR